MEGRKILRRGGVQNPENRAHVICTCPGFETVSISVFQLFNHLTMSFKTDYLLFDHLFKVGHPPSGCNKICPSYHQGLHSVTIYKGQHEFQTSLSQKILQNLNSCVPKFCLIFWQFQGKCIKYCHKFNTMKQSVPYFLQKLDQSNFLGR